MYGSPYVLRLVEYADSKEYIDIVISNISIVVDTIEMLYGLQCPYNVYVHC